MNKKVLAEVLSRPQICARRNNECSGRITIEHSFGRKIEASWNCVLLCWYHHLGGGMNKEINKHLAYQQATDEELMKFKLGTQMVQEKNYLKTKYGNI